MVEKVLGANLLRTLGHHFGAPGDHLGSPFGIILGSCRAPFCGVFRIGFRGQFLNDFRVGFGAKMLAKLIHFWFKRALRKGKRDLRF